MKEKASVKSRLSRSSRSLSTKSSRSDRALKEKLKMAELQAAAEFMEKQQTAEFKVQKLKVEEQYAKSQARMTILEDCKAEVAYAEANPHHTYHNQGVQYKLPAGYDKFTSQIGVPHSNKDQRKTHAKKLESILCDQMSGDTFVKKEHYRESNLVDTTSDMLSKLLRLQPAPDVDIEIFDGNVLNYHYFMALFREVVESKVDDSRGKLIKLIKYTSGDARELIKHCIQLPSNEGCKDAIYLLDKVYGDPHKILASYRKEVKNWQRFHNFLLRCKSVATNQKWNALNTPDMFCMLALRLPSGIRERWNREVLKLRRYQHREPNLEDFTKYVEDESILTSDPLFSRQVLSEYLRPERPVKDDQKKKKVASYRVQSDKSEEADKSKTGKDKESCVLCNGNHDLDECKSYNDIVVKERSMFLTKKKL